MLSENNLKGYIDDFFKDLTLYDDYMGRHDYKDYLHASISSFLTRGDDFSALKVYEMFFMIYQIRKEDKSMEISAQDFQYKSQNIPLDFIKLILNHVNNYNYREKDFLTHSVNVFVLGLSFYSQNTRYREKFEDYVLRSPYKKYYRIEGNLSREEFLYRWGLCSLLHNILPFEFIGKPYRKILNEDFNKVLNRNGENLRIDLYDLENMNSIAKINYAFADRFAMDYPFSRFLDIFKPTDIMAFNIVYMNDFIMEKREFNNFKKYLINFFEYMSDNDFMDNSFISSVFVLNLFGYLIQKYEKDTAFFFYPLVDSATAILLKSIFRNYLQKFFTFKYLNANQNPLAFMLILCEGIESPLKDNHLDIEIDLKEDVIDLVYISKGFSNSENELVEVENLINGQLDLESIHYHRLNVLFENELDDELVKYSSYSFSDIETGNLSLNDIEHIAYLSHNIYNQLERERGNPIVSYYDLNTSMRLSLIRQAKSYPQKLSLIGCEIAPYSDSRVEHMLSEDEINLLAVADYEGWIIEKLNTGYKSHKEDFKKGLISGEEYEQRMKAQRELPIMEDVSPLPWESLNFDSQEKFKRPFRDISYVLSSCNLKIVDIKQKILAIKMHETLKEYSAKNEVIPEFYDLPFEIQLNHYKQSFSIAKSLNELNLELVDIEDERKPVYELENEQIEYLAKRENDFRRLQNIRFGLGESDLYAFRRSLQSDLMVFEKLPQLCQSVGLKIVKSI